MSVRNDLVKVEENEYFDRKTRKFALTNAPWIHMWSAVALGATHSHSLHYALLVKTR